MSDKLWRGVTPYHQIIAVHLSSGARIEVDTFANASRVNESGHAVPGASGCYKIKPDAESTYTLLVPVEHVVAVETF